MQQKKLFITNKRSEGTNASGNPKNLWLMRYGNRYARVLCLKKLLHHVCMMMHVYASFRNAARF